MQTVTIEFERMPDVQTKNVRIVFQRIIDAHRWNSEVVLAYVFVGQIGVVRWLDGFAMCNKSDKFDWEYGMRLSLKRACYYYDRKDIYRAFRRWIWLKKAAHECRKHEHCVECLFGEEGLGEYKQLSHCNTAPLPTIAREFGHVKVTISHTGGAK